MEYLQTEVLDGMMEELLEEFEPMHVLDLLVQNNIVDTEGENQIRARKSRKERVMTTRCTLQCNHNDDRWLLRFAEVLESSAWHRTLGEKLKKKTERILKEVEDIQELYSVSEETFLCLSHVLQIATAIQESDARKLLEYFQVPHTNSSDLRKALVKFILCNKIPILRFKEACNEYKLKYLQDINAEHDMILSFPELQGNFLVKLPASRSHKKVSLLESGTLWESSLFPKETSIKLYVFFRGEYDIQFVKLCDEAKSLCLRIKSKRTLDKLLEENEAGVFGANVAKLVYKPINDSKSTPHIRLDFSKSKLENVRKQLSTSVGDTSSLSSCSSLASFEAGYNEEQSTFDYLDMMDRLTQAINISDIELLCDYFKIDSNSVAKIRGSSNPKRKFIHVCRQNKIWTSKDRSRLVEAVRSNKLTNMENIISARHNDMSLWPEVTVKITPTKPYHSTFTKFKQFMLGKKRALKSEEEEELGMKLLFKVSTAESLDKFKTDIDSGRFLQEILTIYKDETGDNSLMISQEERKSIELIYDENQFKEVLQHGDNEEKSRQHTFDYLDMMDRLIETMDVSDIDLLCNYFNMDHKSLEKIQGSINPKREFIHVCRRKKIWTSGDTLHLLEAVRSTQLTRLQGIIEDFNDMSLCPEVTLTMKSNVPSGAMAEFEEFLLSSKKRLDTKFRREFKVHLVDCEKGSIVFRLKVPSKDSLDQLIGDIHSGRLLKKLMTMFNERTQKETITILEDGKLSIKLSYDTKQVKDASNVLKQPIFTIKDQWKRALMRVQSLMEEDFDPFSLMEILTSNGTLTSTEVDALKATAKRKQRVRLFMSFLETKEETAFNSFLLALEGCFYYEELAKALNSEVKGSQSGYLLSGVTEDMTEGSQVSGKTDEISQQCSTEEMDFDIFLESSGNWNIVRAPPKRFVEDEQMVASLSTHKRLKTTKEVEELAEKGGIYPGTSSNVGNERTDMNDPFDDFLHKIGISILNAGKLTLEDFLKVRNGHTSIDYVTSFWQKITSLDYRAVLPQHLVPSDISMRDFIFCIFHCADEFLKQDIIEKLSACQLAVPLVLGGVKDKNPQLLLWACRRIVKKWKGEGDAFALEQPIVAYPTYTVSVLRIGNVRMSKSKLLNYMLGYSQGYGLHPFFLNKDNDKLDPRFSHGSIESAWFLPMVGNDGEIFKNVTTFFNLRGDCRDYPVQRKFACMSANLTIAIIATEKRSEYVNTIRELKKISSKTLFIAVKEKRNTNGSERSSLPTKKDNWIFVKTIQVDTISRMVCEIIADSCNRNRQTETLLSIEQIAEKCRPYLDVDEDKKECSKAHTFVKDIFGSVEYKDVLEFKQKSFPLQESWREWVELDKAHFESENDDDESFELQREKIIQAKTKQRKIQLEAQLSNTMKLYHSTIEREKNNHDYLQYFLGFLNDKIYQTVSDTILDGMKTILKLEEELSQKESLKEECSAVSVDDVVDKDGEKGRSVRTCENMRQERKLLLKKCRDNNLGFEHFMREIGQLFEAYEELSEKKHQSKNIALFPSIAASLVMEMHSLELMDGDTGRVPLTWVTAVLDQLSLKLNDPKVLVISVVGVQSSGKSTLLNSMFGLRFPVRAGRCTRGLFIRFLPIEEKLAETLGFSYLIVVDTEGIRSIDHDDRRFDNELVTFAFSIANVTIFNIEGENIDSDMTGILQIAAHALMRMKEVDLECKCKIVQQRVADLTAADRNKVSTFRIKQTLDAATKIAAEAEGLEGRYEKFSDVVELKLDEDLQYIPCLWKGGMSPPNHMYSEKVVKIKNGLFQDIKNKIITPELTMTTFTERVRDVWKAVKEEDFVFNFQDSVRAVDFNKFCLEYNGWVVDMRNAIMVKTKSCISEVESSFGSGVDPDIDSLKDSLSEEVENERQTLNRKVREYIENHPRKNIMMKHNQGFRDDISIGLKDAKNQAVMRLSEEFEIRKLRFNLPSLQRKYLPKMLMEAKVTATKMLQATSDQGKDKDALEQHFKDNWRLWIGNLMQEGSLTRKQKTTSCLKSLSEKLLLRMTRDMAVGNEIQNLISQEGGIEKHVELPEFAEYIHVKYVKAWIRHKRMSEQHGAGHKDEEGEDGIIRNETEQASTYVKQVIDLQISELQNQKGKYFDTNIFQLVVRKTLMELSSQRDRFKLPHLLIAKALLHLCGRAFEEVYRDIEENEDELSEIFSEEYYMIQDHFIDFYGQTNINNRAADYIFYYLRKDIDMEIEHLKKYVLNNIQYANYTRRLQLPWDLLKQSVVRDQDWSSRVESLYHFLYADDWYRHSMKQQAENYLQREWEKCCKRIDKDIRTRQKEISDTRLRKIKIVDQRVSSETTFQEWVNELQNCFDELGPFVKEIESIYVGAEFSLVSTILKKCLEKYFRKKFNEVGVYDDFQYSFSSFKTETGLSNLCDEVCPMCGSPCDNIMESHSVHSSFLHRPRGMKGEAYSETSKLILEDCNSSLLLRNATFTFGNETLPCAMYKRRFPNWDIRPTNGDFGKRFWQWLFATQNDWIALTFDCKPADIPQSWFHISEQEALDSLEQDKNLKTKGRSTFHGGASFN
ncbi:interferon-induced very large GTPase 1-like [Apostichopus japonicus]|uniref:interferon-induced very large GTPase 1-like n=1 Tax=Stichopus japonicus TaxID=307972 RepID=UPI003AB13371